MQIGGWSLCDWWSDSHEEGKKEHCLLPPLAPVSRVAEMWSNWPIAAWWHLCTTRALAAETFQPENMGRLKEGTSVSRTTRPAQDLHKTLINFSGTKAHGLGEMWVRVRSRAPGQRGTSCCSSILVLPRTPALDAAGCLRPAVEGWGPFCAWSTDW